MQAIEINLNNKEQAAEQVKLIQKAFDELIETCESQQELLASNAKKLLEAEDSIRNLTNTTIDLSDALKAVHTVLQTKKDLFVNDMQIQELLNSLATFVVSSGAIKMGVLSKKRDDNVEN